MEEGGRMKKDKAVTEGAKREKKAVACFRRHVESPTLQTLEIL